MVYPIGERFDRLTVQEVLPPPPGLRVYKWLCMCDCGVTKAISKYALLDGATSSCGCLRRERAKENVKIARSVGSRGNLKHGMSGTSEWHIWKDMIRRCSDPRRPAWPSYGGRGIRVCEGWAAFEAFYADMGPRPTDLHTIERRNNDENYGPGNCFWATRKEQARNRRSSAVYTAYGHTATIAEWAELLGVAQSRLGHALRTAKSRGQDIEAVLAK